MFKYYPALRFKSGEYNACSRLGRDIGRHVVPRFVIPPPKEVDPELGRTLQQDEISYLTAERIRKNWPVREAFLDTKFVNKYIGETGVKKLFKLVQSDNPNLVAVARMRDLKGDFLRSAIEASSGKLGLHIHFEDALSPEEIVKLLNSVGCESKDCTVFVDFGGAPLDVQDSWMIVADVLEKIWSSAPWRRIVFQGSSYPDKNLASVGGSYSSVRHEWDAFWKAAEESGVPPELLSFGDYGADCSKIGFPKGGGKPIPHARYTTLKAIEVVRGKDDQTYAESMRDVFGRLIRSEHFLGRGYSPADNRIWQVASGILGAGGPSTWRELNMVHHMTLVVRQIGERYGLKFAEVPFVAPQEQLSLI